MDPLTQTVTFLRPTSLNWKQVEAAGDWSLRFSSIPGVAFCFIAAGECRLELSDHEIRHLVQGDYIMLSAPPSWTLSGGGRTPGIDFEKVYRGPDRLKTFVGHPGAEPVTRLIGGHFIFDDGNTKLLGHLVPPLLEIRSTDSSSTGIRSVVNLIDAEAMGDRPGRELVLARLLEVMLVEAIRHAPPAAGVLRQGLLAGLGDRQVGAALRAMHADIKHNWTVAKLAALAGTSRSVFAERFNKIVGMAPIDYLLNWRMATAKDALRYGKMRLADVAYACGYSSQTAFSTAFSRTVGCSPAKYAARGQNYESANSHRPPPGHAGLVRLFTS